MERRSAEAARADLRYAPRLRLSSHAHAGEDARPSGTIATPCSQTRWPGRCMRSRSRAISPSSVSSPASALTSVVFRRRRPHDADDLVVDPEIDAVKRLRVPVERAQPLTSSTALPSQVGPRDRRVVHHDVRSAVCQLRAPWTSTTMRSARPLTARITCSTMRIVAPPSRILCRTPAPHRPLPGSNRR